MKIYVVVEPDADPYCGTWVIGVFSTRKKAENYIKTTDEPQEKDIEEWEIDSTTGEPISGKR